jgi:polyisoprenoid-binding protein YceI
MDKVPYKPGSTVTHLLISEVSGNFKDYDVIRTSIKDELSEAMLELTENINSIDKGQEPPVGYLKGTNWFEAATYPTLSFKSTFIKKVSEKI